MEDRNLFISLVDNKGIKRVLNKRYIVKAQSKDENSTRITLHIPSNPSSIELHTFDKPIEEIGRILMG